MSEFSRVVLPPEGDDSKKYYRVPFFGTLLVEAESKEIAGVAAGMWSASMKHATHAVPMQPIRPEVKAVDFCVERSKREDATDELAASMQDIEHSATINPGGHLLAKKLSSSGQLDYLQIAWEQCEFERMRPESERDITD